MKLLPSDGIDVEGVIDDICPDVPSDDEEDAGVVVGVPPESVGCEVAFVTVKTAAADGVDGEAVSDKGAGNTVVEVLVSFPRFRAFPSRLPVSSVEMGVVVKLDELS